MTEEKPYDKVRKIYQKRTTNQALDYLKAEFEALQIRTKNKFKLNNDQLRELLKRFKEHLAQELMYIPQ